MNQHPGFLGTVGHSAQVAAAVALTFLGAVVIAAVLLTRRRHKAAVAKAHSQHVRELTRLLLRAQYDYPRPSLADLVHASRKGGLAVRLHVAGSPRMLPDPVDLAGMRIIHESLTNALKHGTPHASVVLGYKPNLLTVTVDSALSGRTHAGRTEHGGLEAARRRAEKVGGWLTAGPYQGGWRVHAELPCRR
ncbi:hypothetical protein Sme01_54270 [Sphaerisporangium melleum]|uniref:histidine kinase n=1 Tax=Sphaerisporangium melleum TaxID=321316 RepID=A0A917VL71_9ACTN|nr:hypothetical protein [Sphaerisporangium melleum]GGK91908.1 hypothetical protein GCM10007964_38130 [Sphaerisporangium melleum]GII72951.1 hypothetical protein Sme01_54270 [Sphaerisporangium melleum]